MDIEDYLDEEKQNAIDDEWQIRHGDALEDYLQEERWNAIDEELESRRATIYPSRRDNYEKNVESDNKVYLEPSESSIDYKSIGANLQPSIAIPAAKTDTVGIVLFTEKVLGKGGNGTFVYEGLYNNKVVAVKSIFKCWAEKQLLPEITALTKCGPHENIVQYLNFKEEPERYLLALELCKCNLNDWIKNPDCISETNFTEHKALTDSTRGLGYLHEKRIVHRDLKPGNILISVGGDIATVKLADFGISKFLPDESSSITITSVMGTERWMSPEVLKFIEEKEVIGESTAEPEKIKMSGKSDIFALGLVFFFVLSKGRHVFGVTRSETRRNILNPAFQPIIMFNDAKWQAYKVIIQQMIQHDPTLRPACEDVLKNILGLSVRESL